MGGAPRSEEAPLDLMTAAAVQRSPQLRAGRDEHHALAPGSTIGVLGGGQLGRMMAMAARRLGYRFVILDPDPDAPAAGVADDHVVAPYSDAGAVSHFAEAVDVLTVELEHVDLAALGAVDRVLLRPGVQQIRVTQDRLAERRWLESMGAPVAAWREVRTTAQLEAALAALGLPCRLKVALGGYDGRSQVRIASRSDLAGAIPLAADRSGLLLERELDFEAELSVVCARGSDGAISSFPVAHNRHDEGILVESVAPAPIPGHIARRAQALAARLAAGLGLVGTLTAELFLLRDGELVVNELAPRVHNSGHYTEAACTTSQFEQHVRAICGLPLGDVSMRGPTAMVNILGTGPRRPARLLGLEDALADPLVAAQLYGKKDVFDRRKMGHLTVVTDDLEVALARAREALRRLTWAAE